MTDGERDRGILAPVDRQWLRGEKEYGHRQQHYDRRMTIQDRVRDGILDFIVLFEHLDDEEYDEIFGDLENDPDLRRGVEYALAFLFYAVGNPEMTPDLPELSGEPSHKAWNPQFDDLLEEAYDLALLRYDFLVDIDGFEPPEAKGEHIEGVSVVRERAEAGEELSPRLIQMLLYSDAIESEPIQEVVRERLLEDIPAPGDETDEE